MGRKLSEADLIAAHARAELDEAARDVLAWKLILAVLLRRSVANCVRISRQEFSDALAQRGASLERVVDPKTGEMLVRLADTDEDKPEEPKGKVVAP